MNNKEAYKLIGERAKELSANLKIQKKMLEIAREKGREEAERLLYLVAIATLVGQEANS